MSEREKYEAESQQEYEAESQQAYEVESQLWYWEKAFYEMKDYGFKDDPEYVKWAEDRAKADKAYQMEHDKPIIAERTE